MVQVVTGIIFIIAGMMLIVFRAGVAEYNMKFQKTYFHSKYSDKDKKDSEQVTLLGGFVSIVVGALTIIGSL